MGATPYGTPLQHDEERRDVNQCKVSLSSLGISFPLEETRPIQRIYSFKQRCSVIKVGFQNRKNRVREDMKVGPESGKGVPAL